MYLNFLERVLFELSWKNTRMHTHIHTDYDDYSIAAFCKNATIKRHLLKHTEERPHICRFCKTFNDKNAPEITHRRSNYQKNIL